MKYGIHLRVSGDYALFSRPEMKVERVSHDVITPSSARGVLGTVGAFSAAFFTRWLAPSSSRMIE